MARELPDDVGDANFNFLIHFFVELEEAIENFLSEWAQLLQSRLRDTIVIHAVFDFVLSHDR